MDPEVVALCDAMNALPGIRTLESCCGHGAQPLRVFFEVNHWEGMDGLFYLTRCADRRYWKYGYLWRIELSVADVMHNGLLPITFELNSGPIVGEDAYAQALDLVENMDCHLVIKAFLDKFALDMSKFGIRGVSNG